MTIQAYPQEARVALSIIQRFVSNEMVRVARKLIRSQSALFMEVNGSNDERALESVKITSVILCLMHIYQ